MAVVLAAPNATLALLLLVLELSVTIRLDFKICRYVRASPMLLGGDSHDGFCMGTIISSTPLHKVRHFQLWHAILDVTYIWRLGMCTTAQRF